MHTDMYSGREAAGSQRPFSPSLNPWKPRDFFWMVFLKRSVGCARVSVLSTQQILGSARPPTIPFFVYRAPWCCRSVGWRLSLCYTQQASSYSRLALEVCQSFGSWKVDSGFSCAMRRQERNVFDVTREPSPILGCSGFSVGRWPHLVRLLEPKATFGLRYLGAWGNLRKTGAPSARRAEQSRDSRLPGRKNPHAWLPHVGIVPRDGTSRWGAGWGYFCTASA